MSRKKSKPSAEVGGTLHDINKKYSRFLLLAAISFLFAFSISLNIVFASTTIQLQNETTENLEDVYISSDAPDTNYNYVAALFLGRGTLENDITRGLIKFNISSVPSNISSIDAKLCLYIYASTGTQDTGDNYGAHRVDNTTWLEDNITWNGHPSYEATPDDTVQNLDDAPGEKCWNVTTGVSYHYYNSYTNSSWLIKSSDEVWIEKDQWGARSKEGATVSLRPYLNITYSPNIAPQFYTNITKITTPATFDSTATYGWQVNWTDTDGNFENATFQLGRPDETYTNYTNHSTSPDGIFVFNDTYDIFYINITQEQLGPVGTYNGTWYGNDTIGLENSTEAVLYTVVQADPTTNMVLTLDGDSTASQSRTYPNATDVQASETNSVDTDCEYTLVRNGTVTSNGAITLAAEIYNFTYNVSSCTNFTAGSLERILTVNVNTTATEINILLNDTLNTDKLGFWPADTNATCVINRDTENTFTMVRNGTVVGTQVGDAIEYNDDLVAGIYNFTCNYTGQNYTAFVRENNFILAKTSATVKLFINDTQVIAVGDGGDPTYVLNGTAINLTAVTEETGETISIYTNFTSGDIQDGVTSITNITVWNTSTVPKLYQIDINISTVNYTDAANYYYMILDDVVIVKETYETDILESSEQTISIVFDYPVGTEDLHGTLIWKDTVYTNDSVTMNSTHITLSKTFTVPTITTDTENIDFFWNYSYNGNEHKNRTSTIHSQLIHRPQLTICNTTYNTSAVTLTFINETDDFTVINASTDLVLNFTVDGTPYIYNNSFINETVHLCIFPAWSNFTVDGHIQYSNNSYQTRDYWLDSEIFDNTTETLDLMFISTVLAPKPIRFTVNDQYGAPYPNIIIKPQRWYPGLNEYLTVASLKANEQGQSNTYLVLNIIYYRFLLQVDGDTITTIPARLIPDDGTSLIEIQLTVNPEELIDYIRYYNKITGTCAYANVTGNLSCSYTDTTTGGLLTSVDFLVKEFAGALATSTVCSETNTTVPTGSFICHIGNESAYTNIYKYTMIGDIDTGDDDTLLIYSGMLDKKEGVSKLFGDCSSVANLGKCREGAVIAFMLTLIAALIGTYSPSVGIMLSLSGVVLTGAMGLWAMSALVGIGLFFLAAIFIYMSR